MSAITRFVSGVLFAAVILSQVALCCSIVTLPIQVSRTFSVRLEYSGKPLSMRVNVVEKETEKLVRETMTDASGRAEIRNLAPGTYTVTSPVSNETIEVLPGGGSKTLSLSALLDRKPIEMTAVDGVVTDITGTVMPNVIAVLERADPWHTPVGSATTNSSGRLSLKGSPGYYELRVARDGFQTAVVPVRIVEKGWAGFKLTLQVGGCPSTGDYKIAEER